MQYTKRDWRNRNKIKTVSGLKWLSIGVQVKGKYYQKINETLIKEPFWGDEHWNKITENYRNAPYFKEYSEILKPIYKIASQMNKLSDINYLFIEKICQILNIKTKITKSSDYQLIDGKTERLLHLCISSGANVYITGPAAKSYLDESLFRNKNITVEWMNYNHYPEYLQLFGEFEHNVSILDVLFNCGPKANLMIF